MSSRFFGARCFRGDFLCVVLLKACAGELLLVGDLHFPAAAAASGGGAHRRLNAGHMVRLWYGSGRFCDAVASSSLPISTKLMDQSKDRDTAARMRGFMT